MTKPEIDIWLRGTNHATTAQLPNVNLDASQWTDDDVRQLLTEMLLAINRQKHPGAEAPNVTLRGFNWIVSPEERGGVIVHVEMQTGTASAGPFGIDEPRLTGMINRVLGVMPSTGGSSTVH